MSHKIIEVGDIVRVFDGSWSIDQYGIHINGNDMPSEAEVVEIDPNFGFPAFNSNNQNDKKGHDGVKLSRVPILNNNLKITHGNKIIYTRSQFCKIIHKYYSPEVRKRKLNKLNFI